MPQYPSESSVPRQPLALSSPAIMQSPEAAGESSSQSKNLVTLLNQGEM